MQLAIFTAWHTARLTKYSGDRLKSLSEEMTKLDRALRPPKPQTREQMIQAMRHITSRSVH